MGNKGGLGRRRDRLWVGLRSTLAQASLHTYTPLTPRFFKMKLHLCFHIPLRPPHLCGQLTDYSCEHVPLTYETDDIIKYNRIATSKRSATCALLDDYKITATARSNAIRKSPSLYISTILYGCYGCYMDEIYHAALSTTSTTLARLTPPLS